MLWPDVDNVDASRGEPPKMKGKVLEALGSGPTSGPGGHRVELEDLCPEAMIHYR